MFEGTVRQGLGMSLVEAVGAYGDGGARRYSKAARQYNSGPNGYRQRFRCGKYELVRWRHVWARVVGVDMMARISHHYKGSMSPDAKGRVFKGKQDDGDMGIWDSSITGAHWKKRLSWRLVCANRWRYICACYQQDLGYLLQLKYGVERGIVINS